jgi:hypothetical protein
MAAIGFSTLVISELNKMTGECWTRGAKQSIIKSKDNKEPMLTPLEIPAGHYF